MYQESDPDLPPDHGPLSLLLADTAACVRFFSRLPIPRTCPADDPAASPDFGRISRTAPLAGLIVALPASLLGLVLGFTQLPSLATAFVMCGALAMITGALHEDGLADVADGFFGGSTPERRLEIMKDSRIGAFGALALMISIGLRAALIAALLTRYGPTYAILVFLGAEAFSRALLVWQWSTLLSARPDGLGARFGIPGPTATRQAILLGVLCLIPGASILSVSALSAGLLLSTLTAHVTAKLALRKIGGFTGDVLGAIQQVATLGFLVGVLALP